LEGIDAGATVVHGPEVLLSYTIGHCGGVRGPRCGYSDSEYRNSPCCAPSLVRENADTYAVYTDCTMVHTTGVGVGASGHIFSESQNLSATGCIWAKSAVTKELIAAIDDPMACTDSSPGREAVDVRSADGRLHHKELVRHCEEPTLAWFRTSFVINCVYKH
jgi:hypothetical protein